MNKIKRLLKRKTTWIILILFVFVYVNNSSFFAERADRTPLLLAHRGLSQTFSMEGIEGDTCTAERINKPEYPYLENTIPSMEAAFKAGADLVEFDVQPTKDNNFVIFHDWTLDCRTNGKGVTRDFTTKELQALDIGYGYTADGGKTFPFRGQGINLMPTLDEVLNHFPDRSFLIHIKSDDENEGIQLAAYLKKLPAKRLEQLTVYGGDKPIAAIKERIPSLRSMSKATMKKDLLTYIALGWTGYMPSSLKHGELHIPDKVAPWLWGWPNRFLNRMDKADTRVIVVGGNGFGFSSGFDSLEDIKRLPDDYTGGIWTNRIDKIAPVFQK
ncbi:glycerophosphodiester phosphodiesterase [Bacillus cereus]|uniref:glycerophosphodiester phosphodiesterase family protein n=1 Tax=Bacillus cereus group TaxID=86661 RepID=UPI0007FB3B2E|nr:MULTISPECIES: glycerophosphodiester phosphodiesterase family protein [Bacillus cereus group]MCP1399835.1 glycerophosphoryl diester phosphodiesterase [Bacillus cereus]MCU5668817.1 glycerophosphodiester phosphodiesterase family protein [Bacillus cereus]OBW85071.1 glycerophosphodiester phosphodiesterase [Bacillus cereus]PED86692.1 glycerophosphodiester phosphodiesterase [Bacillus cereus]PER62662.1 glycerophosphodiester phosphodiesterase [Bacillus cereus]